jgi:hypothetical protein
MCGIAGWISFNRDLGSERLTVDAMTEPCRAVARTTGAPGWPGPRRLGTVG